MTTLLTFGLGWLTGWFIIQFVIVAAKGGRLLASKDEIEQIGGCLVLFLSPIFYGLAIATTIGALFAIHG